MGEEIQIPVYLELVAVFLWALSGGLVAARRRWDFAGIFVLALVTATGGGLIRDGLFLQQGLPALLRSPNYLIIVGATTLVVFAFGRRIHRMRHFNGIVTFVDAWGIGTYGVVGCQLALDAGVGFIGAVLVGVVNAEGGGLLRDLLARREPELFRPGHLAGTAAFVGCLVYVTLISYVPEAGVVAPWLCILLVFIIRMLSIRLGVTTRPARGFEDYETTEIDVYKIPKGPKR